MGMRLVFRADASLELGSGHVMRCAAIATAAMSRGYESILVGTLGGIRWLLEHLNDKGITIIESAHYGPFFSKENDVLIVDSYCINPNDSFLQEANWKGVVSLCDPLTPNYAAKIYVHPGLDSSWFQGPRNNFYFGYDFLPMRDGISRNITKSVSTRCRKIIVFGGGTDPYGFGTAIARILTNCRNFDSALFFCNSGSGIPEMDSRFVVKAFGRELDFEISTADLVLTTSSTSSLEIVARGLPLGVVCAVNNQESLYRSLTELNVAAAIGVRDEANNWNFDIGEIDTLINNSMYRSKLVDNSKDLIDFQGTQRILDLILQLNS